MNVVSRALGPPFSFLYVSQGLPGLLPCGHLEGERDFKPAFRQELFACLCIPGAGSFVRRLGWQCLSVMKGWERRGSQRMCEQKKQLQWKAPHQQTSPLSCTKSPEQRCSIWRVGTPLRQSKPLFNQELLLQQPSSVSVEAWCTNNACFCNEWGFYITQKSQRLSEQEHLLER